MTISILIGLGVVLAAVILFIIFRSGRADDDDFESEDIVPISDPKEIKQIKNVFEAKATPPPSMETSSQESANPQPQVDSFIAQEKEKLKEEKENFQAELLKIKQEAEDKIQDLSREVGALKQALQEAKKSQKETPAPVEAEKLKDLNEKVSHAEGSLMRLNGENTRLRRLVEEQKQMLAKFDQGFDAMAVQNKSQKEQQAMADEVIQEELDRVKEELQKHDQKSKITQDKLKTELQKLQKEKDQLAQANQELERAQRELQASLKKETKGEQLTEENVDLRQQLQKAEVQAQKIQESMEVMKINYEQKLNDAQDEIYKLKNPSSSAAKEGSAKIDPTALSKKQLDDVSKELEQLRSEMEDLKIDRQKLEDQNTQLLEKDRLAEFELTKNRAQAQGLEKICEELKRKVEMQAAAQEED